MKIQNGINPQSIEDQHVRIRTDGRIVGALLIRGNTTVRL